jgi:DNA repair protein RadC
VPSHPEALQERQLTLPHRIDDPESAASTARALLCNRKEDVTLVLYMDDRHRFTRHAVGAVGWVQASHLSVRPIVLGGTASQATGCILVRYGRYWAFHATEAEDASFRAIADAAARHGVAVVDHLVVVPRAATAWSSSQGRRLDPVGRRSPVVPSMHVILLFMDGAEHASIVRSARPSP